MNGILLSFFIRGDILAMRLIYTPVSTSSKDLINCLHPNCFFNPVREMPKNINTSGKNEYFADSGGYQIFHYTEKQIKPVIVIPSVGIRNTPNRLVIDPIDLCERFGRLGIKYGFTLDIPLSNEPSEEEFTKNLEESYRWAQLMFQHRYSLCPDTRFLIPLHYSTKDDLHRYFDRMSELNPEGYAFAVRDQFYDLAWNVWVACTLSFLHSKGVQKAHMLGSSREEVIMIGAAALGLRLFKQISFDSRSWNTLRLKGPPWYFDPVKRQRVYLRSDFFQNTYLSKSVLRKTNLGERLMLSNAWAISEQANRTLERAKDIESLKKYIQEHQNLKRKREKILTSISILEGTAERGYGFVERWLGRSWA